MIRVTIGFLQVRDTHSKSTVLPPGTVLTECKVVRHSPMEGSEPYLVHFTAGGRSYTCPLYAFQPRTDASSSAAEEAALAV